MKVNIPTIRQLLFMVSISILMASCNNKKDKDTSYDYVYAEPETQVSEAISSLAGEWRLDSVVFTNNNIRGKKQIPFSTTIWSFTDKGEYTVKIQQNQFDGSIVEDGVKREKSLTAEIPSSKMKGRYRQSNQELITNIMGGNTKYTIVNQSDNKLTLRSQRFQVPPISKEDEGKLAEHYFTSVQSHQ